MGKTLVVRSCHVCGVSVTRESHLDHTTTPMNETTTFDADHPMSKEFKKMLLAYSGDVRGSWGMSPTDFKPSFLVIGAMQLNSMASYFDLRLTCPGCGYSR